MNSAGVGGGGWVGGVGIVAQEEHGMGVPCLSGITLESGRPRV